MTPNPVIRLRDSDSDEDVDVGEDTCVREHGC